MSSLQDCAKSLREREVDTSTAAETGMLGAGDSWLLERLKASACYDLAMSKTVAPTDWTGVAPDTSPVRPLDAHTFAVRLHLLSERAECLTILRRAFAEQHSRGEQLPRHSEPASRPSR